MSDMNRRGWGLGVALGLAALGGGALLRSRSIPLAPLPAPDAASSGASTPPLVPIPTALTTLDGKTLTATDIGGRAVLLNFWAPWCPPCVHEMPEIDRFARSAAGKDTLVIGLAIDEKPAVEKFISEHPVGFPIVVLGYAGLSWVRRLGNDSQALPFSVSFDRSQAIAHRKAGPTNVAELSSWTSQY